jgi:hypothetical protein
MKPAELDTMNVPQVRINARIALQSLAMAIVVVAACFLWEGHVGFSLWDEGYLWYGVQRAMQGEVPLRDFQSYDPGRYYWSGALMRLAGTHGIIAVRLTIVAMQAAALAAALASLAALLRGRGRLVYLIVSALVLVVWMAPRHKVFDISISIGLVAVLAAWISQATPRRALLSGVYVGLVAWFGRNHGVYGLVASMGVLAYLAVRCEGAKAWWTSAASLVGGIAIGYVPMLLMMALVSGFTPALIDSIRFIFEVGSTNLPLPIPWPWKARFGLVPLHYAINDLVVGLFFVGLVVFAAWGTLAAFHGRLRGRPAHPLVVAASIAAIPYTHYAFSRADVGHLAQGVFPMLIGLLALFSVWRSGVRIGLAVLLLVASAFAATPLHPGWTCRTGGCVVMDIDGDVLKVEPQAAQDVQLLRRLDKDFASNGKAFYVTPLLPGSYALLHRRSPTWEIYTAWPRSDAFQRAEIERLEEAHPGFVVVYDLALDGRDELRFARTHPLIEAYIESHYDRVDGYSDNPASQIYKARARPD